MAKKRRMTTAQIPMALPGVLPPEARGQAGAESAMLSAGAKDLRRALPGQLPPAGTATAGTRKKRPPAAAQRSAIQRRLAQAAGGGNLAVNVGARRRV